MNQDDIIRMAQEAWGLEFIPHSDVLKLERFAALVAAHEREACAKTVEKIETYEKIEKACFKFAAKKIRARGNK